MGKTVKKLKLDEEEEQLKPLKSQIVLSSDDDEEANEDLSLKIVEKAKLRACSTNSKNDTVLDPSTTPLLEAASAVQHVKKKKLKKVKKKSKRIEAEDVSVDVDKEVEKAEECKSLETGKLVEEKVDISDNIVLRKLLRGPRYFDPPDSGWGTCYNCGEEGHTTVNCTLAKRKRPCFVCGSLEHNAKQCVKGKDCFICKKGGHRAKDCPEKRFAGGPQSDKICLKCGQSGHEMFSCKNDYSSDDLKEIQCYICKSFGHLCCVNYTSAAAGEFSCYRCGQSGHTGLACTRLRREPNGTGPPSSCYRCGEEGHFARECASSAKVPKRRHESTPKQKRSKQDENYFEGRSLPHDPNTMKREKNRYEGGFSTPSKSKLNFGSITHDTGDFPRRKAKTYSRKSPATPTNNNNKFSYSTAGGSDSYGQARELQFGNSASNDFKVKQPRISSWRFRNSNKGGMP